MPIAIASYAFGHAAQNPGCADGPITLHHSQYLATDLPLEWRLTLEHPSQGQQREAEPSVTALCHELGDFTADCVRHRQRFLTIGGDHSSAIGTWSGAAHALQDSDALGLIWFDAHMDSHTFITTPSNNIHGMPLAVLLGHGEHALTHLMTPVPKLQPNNVVLIGVRSFEPGEAALLNALGVTIYSMEQVKQQGMIEVMRQAIHQVTQSTRAFGISIDLDGIDPIDAPGVGSPATNGVKGTELLESLMLLHGHDSFIGAEIAEFNPHLDRERKTEKLACDIITRLATNRSDNA